jgi:hypothetical protein
MRVHESHRGRTKSVVPLSNLEWVDCRVKCGRKPGEANT